MTEPEVRVARAVSEVFTANFLASRMPTGQSEQVIEIAEGHLAAALKDYKHDIAREVVRATVAEIGEPPERLTA